MKLLVLAVLFLAGSILPAAAQNREALCRVLPVKGQFEGAEYVPGVDVSGKPVVPADLNSRRALDIDVIRFPVTIDLAQQLNIVFPEGAEMQTSVAMVDIHPDGRVILDGEDFGPDLYALCGKEPFNYKAEPMKPPAVPGFEPASEPPVTLPAPAPSAKPMEPVEPEVKEEIIWGEGY